MPRGFYSRPPVKERFNEKWMPEPFSGCWLWLGGVKSNGYGMFRMNNRLDTAHRCSWRIFRGDIPAGLCVCHKCDTLLCVNPDHLFIGTQRDNMDDMVAKHRGGGPHLLGERNGASKLKESQVLEIRNDSRSRRLIAKDYDVSYATIKDIQKKEHWKHL